MLQSNRQAENTDFSACSQIKCKGEKKDKGKESSEHNKKKKKPGGRKGRNKVLLQSTLLKNKREGNIDHAAANSKKTVHADRLAA